MHQLKYIFVCLFLKNLVINIFSIYSNVLSGCSCWHRCIRSWRSTSGLCIRLCHRSGSFSICPMA